MATYDPFRDLDRLAAGLFDTRRGPRRMPMDLYRDGDHYVLTADLPGIDPGSVDIDVDGQLLTIRAERTLTSGDDVKWITREREGASFLRHDATVWTTDKDGLIMDLLAAEITARTGRDPGEHVRELMAKFGTPHYTRIDAPATPALKARLGQLSADAVQASTLAGEPIVARLTRARRQHLGNMDSADVTAGVAAAAYASAAPIARAARRT